MSPDAALLWFDLNLRLRDNPALDAAIAEHEPIVPVFIWAPEEEAPWPPGAASRWWLHQSLEQLNASLAAHGSKLIIRRGPTAETLRSLCEETGARTVYWNRRYEPSTIARDRELTHCLAREDIAVRSFEGNVLFEPGTVFNNDKKPYQVFTRFWNAIQQKTVRQPLPLPKGLRPPSAWPSSLELSDLALEPKIAWAGGLRATWRPGEAGASEALDRFIKGNLAHYATGRDRPDHRSTSCLSPHLHFGEISVVSVWYAAADYASFRRELAWREFSQHLLFHFPYTADRPLRAEFRSFPWQLEDKTFNAWIRGSTGYPMVDAGMRELWHTGWMHNRVRMIVASFLVKDLLIPWQEGSRWFWDTLVDADLANNTMGWQWTAGCGADAAPYFRIFNPAAQRERFDPNGDYVRRWVPELNTPAYPPPIIEHSFARKRALAAFAELKNRRAV